MSFKVTDGFRTIECSQLYDVVRRSAIVSWGFSLNDEAILLAAHMVGVGCGILPSEELYTKPSNYRTLILMGIFKLHELLYN